VRLRGVPIDRAAGGNRRGTDVVVVEDEPGTAIVIAAWMLDRSVCAGLEIGEPQVSVLALVDLDRLLKNQGLRRVVSNGAGVIREARSEEFATSESSGQVTAPACYRAGFARADEHERHRNHTTNDRLLLGMNGVVT